MYDTDLWHGTWYKNVIEIDSTFGLNMAWHDQVRLDTTATGIEIASPIRPWLHALYRTQTNSVKILHIVPKLSKI